MLQPRIDILRAGPILSHHIRSKLVAIFDISILGKNADHPRAKALHEIEAKPIKAQLLDQHARIVEHRRVNQWISMAQMRKSRIVLSLDHELFIPAGMKTVPVPRKAAALRPELCPPLLTIQRIHLLLIRAGVVIDHHVGVQSNIVRMSLRNQRLKLGTIPIQRLSSALLVIVAKIEVVVRVIPIRPMVRSLRDRRQPQRIHSRFAKILHFFGNMIPPLTLFLLLDRRIPVKSLHHYSHFVWSPFRSMDSHPHIAASMHACSLYVHCLQ